MTPSKFIFPLTLYNYLERLDWSWNNTKLMRLNPLISRSCLSSPCACAALMMARSILSVTMITSSLDFNGNCVKIIYQMCCFTPNWRFFHMNGYFSVDTSRIDSTRLEVSRSSVMTEQIPIKCTLNKFPRSNVLEVLPLTSSSDSTKH